MSYATPAQFLEVGETLSVDLSTVGVTANEPGPADEDRLQTLLDLAAAEIDTASPPTTMSARCMRAEILIAWQLAYGFREKELPQTMRDLLQVEREWLKNLSGPRTETGTGAVEPTARPRGFYLSNETPFPTDQRRMF